MDTILLAMARGKKTSEAQIIRALEKVQKPHNQLEGLYNDIKELHKNHMRKKERGSSDSSSAGVIKIQQKRSE